MAFFFRCPISKHLHSAQIVSEAEAYGRLRFFDFLGHELFSYALSAPLAIPSSPPAINPLAPAFVARRCEAKEIFLQDFASLQREFATQNLQKAVLFHRWHWQVAPTADLLARWQGASEHLYALYLDSRDLHYLGLSPELLFLQQGTQISTFALAGTRAIDADYRPDEFLNHSKDRREHELVVTDLVTKLQALGALQVGETEVVELRHLAHLKTPIHLQAPQNIKPEDLLRRLHPSSALGAYPSISASPWYQNYLSNKQMQLAAAPVLVEWPDYQYCVVGIRSAFKINSQGDFQVVAGAGILPESDREKEWQEIVNKQNSVWRALGGGL